MARINEVIHPWKLTNFEEIFESESTVDAMNILIAPDKFKGTLSAEEAGSVIAGVLKEVDGFTVQVLPLADGGEGTLELFLSQGGRQVDVRVHDPLMRERMAPFGLSADGRTAYVEMARASGLMLLKPEEFNPLRTTSYGTGELIRRAVETGAEEIVLGIGGSATTDAGMGMMEALGMRFFDAQGNVLRSCGESLLNIHEADETHCLPGLRSVKFSALCDVTNPFYGPDGAAHVYSPQKGATPGMVDQLDRGLRHVCNIIKATQGMDLQQVPGSGAGGGLAGGAVAWLNASLRPGFDVVAEWVKLEAMIRWADVIITGEGKVDAQSLKGKVVSGILRRALPFGKKVMLVCGQLAGDFSPPDVPVYAMADHVGGHEAWTQPESSLRRLIAEVVAPDLRKFRE